MVLMHLSKCNEEKFIWLIPFLLITIADGLVSYIFFNEIPGTNTFVGMCLIVVGGIYIFIREKIQDQPIVTEKPLR